LEHLGRRRHRWFVYATFAHSAASLDSAVAPADDERDNVVNVAPHVAYVENALYEYLPGLSRGTGAPQPTARLEVTTVDLVPGAAKAFEVALGAGQSTLQGETLWYRMVAGGGTPRYVRLRPRHSLSALLDGRSAQALPEAVNHLIARTSIEIWTLRPTMSLGLGTPARVREAVTAVPRGWSVAGLPSHRPDAALTSARRMEDLGADCPLRAVQRSLHPARWRLMARATPALLFDSVAGDLVR
jgi:hypothetical protein